MKSSPKADSAWAIARSCGCAPCRPDMAHYRLSSRPNASVGATTSSAWPIRRNIMRFRDQESTSRNGVSSQIGLSCSGPRFDDGSEHLPELLWLAASRDTHLHGNREPRVRQPLGKCVPVLVPGLRRRDQADLVGPGERCQGMSHLPRSASAALEAVRSLTVVARPKEADQPHGAPHLLASCGHLKAASRSLMEAV